MWHIVACLAGNQTANNNLPHLRLMQTDQKFDVLASTDDLEASENKAVDGDSLVGNVNSNQGRLKFDHDNGNANGNEGLGVSVRHSKRRPSVCRLRAANLSVILITDSYNS